MDIAHTLPAATPALSPPPVQTVPRGLFGLLLVAFVLACVFDPADLVLGVKVWLFVAFTAVGVLGGTSERERERFRVPPSLVLYVAVFIAVPLLSVIIFKFTNSAARDEGFGLLKGYVLIAMSLVLAGRRFDLLPTLSWILLSLALIILGCAVALAISPGLYGALYDFGNRTGIVSVDERFYSENFSLQQLYFVTSPMLVMSIAYNFARAREASNTYAKRLFYLFMLASMAAMAFAGTRNNIFVAFCLPVALISMQSKNKFLGTTIAMIFAVAILYIFQNEITLLLNPEEVSNSTKLALLDDYRVMFSDPSTFLFGQGLGTYQYWFAKGRFDYITELTYFEMLRNFGIFGAVLLGVLLVKPTLMAFRPSRSLQDRTAGLAFAFYLLMCISNPNLFSSMGILILAVLISKFYSDSYWQERELSGAHGV